MTLRTLITFFLITMTTTCAFAQGDPQQRVPIDDQQNLDAIMAKIEEKRQSIVDFQADFEQVKVIMPFEDTETATGAFLYKKPDRIIWEFKEPEQSKVLVNGQHGLVITDAVKQVQMFGIDEHNRFDFMLAGLGKSIDQFLDDFSMQCFSETSNDGTPLYVFEMEPKNDDLKGVISKCEITVDAQELIPVSSKVIEASGDITILIFSGIRINDNLEDSVFHYVIPPDYELIDYR